MFVRALRKYRKGFIGLTVLFGLLMAVCSLANMVFALLSEMEEFAELGLSLPETEKLLAWAGWAYIAVFGAFSAVMGANILGKEMRSGAISMMTLLPVSRGNIVLSHYCAGALYAVLCPLIVGAVTFGALSAQGMAEGIVVSLLAPALGFMAVYSIAFAVASIVKNVVAPVLTGGVALLMSTFAGAACWYTGPIAQYAVIDLSTGMSTEEVIELAEPIYGNVNGLFAAYGTQWGVSVEAILVAVLLCALSVLVAFAVYSRKNL